MSWTGYQENDELTSAIGEASNDNILMFCSTSDDNRSRDSIWQSETKVFKVAAADKYGYWRPQSDRDADLLLPGDSIMASGPQYMRPHSKSTISGSSVATALAAGLASLVISCAIAENKTSGREQFKRKKIMEKVFHAMRERDGHKYLLPEKLLESMEHAKLQVKKWS